MLTGGEIGMDLQGKPAGAEDRTPHSVSVGVVFLQPSSNIVPRHSACPSVAGVW